MKASTAHRLLRLNREFYTTFAAEFADSRSALQPGIVRALRQLGTFGSLVDVGCGDGRVGRALAAGVVAHTVNRYLGIDFSSQLIEQARAAHAPLPPDSDFSVIDFSAPGWLERLGEPTNQSANPSHFDAAVCFSTLHHIPGARRRLRLLRELRALLGAGARCAISVWQFLHISRLQRKIVPWSEIGLRPEDVDENDYLLDWLRGGRGLRYVHHFDEAELVNLCRRAGFGVLETYRSDGRASGGELGLYVLLEAVLY
ncbi:MAG TPA: class I SAM-dependent methyltransferase [Anaerolineae bacterium]|nr:class I SAM-dependent methyltransferase [Anaerolineae bacterium]